ncbi:MAG: PIN domain-containing protein [Alistipes sp.]|nr:PIN domain-containing protein [Alistipes sp.]
MAYYLVDYENVNVNGMNGIKKLAENDSLVIFYSENASTMTFGLHKRLNESKAVIEYCNVGAGTKNALDFQLASYLGYLIGKCPEPQNEKFYIISKDNGFQILQKYWSRFKVNISVISQISVANEKNITDNGGDISIIQLLSSVQGISEYIPQIIQIINTSKNKTSLNTELTRLIKDGKKVSAVHSAIKSYTKTLPVI